MEKTSSRRDFIETGAVAGGWLLLRPLPAPGATRQTQPTPERYVFDERMSYCCAECTPEKCKWLGNDMEFKTKKASELSKKLGRTLRPEEMTCSRCRVPEDEASDGIRGCRIRQCVVDKKLLSCAHCRELPVCKHGNPTTRERALAIQRVVLGERE